MTLHHPRRWAVGLLAALLAACTALCLLAPKGEAPKTEDAATPTAANARRAVAGIKAVWLNYIEFGELISGKDEAAFSAAADEVVENLASLGFNTLFLHVRAHWDSFYPSDLFPWAAEVNDGAGVPYDPLAILLEKAHRRGVALHAWVNPYRIAGDGADPLPPGSPAAELVNKGENDVAASAGGLYANPASPAAQRVILNGLRELLERYAVDGLQFDDYFYPTTDESFDAPLYRAYCEKAASPLPLADFRRAQVNTLITATFQLTRRTPGVVFGVSPAASLRQGKEELFADPAAWAASGVVDYLCPQLYFGFSYPQADMRFDALLSEWKAACPAVPLVIGLASYKLGEEDAGSREWVTATDVLERQAALALQENGAAGVAVYHYGSLLKGDEQSTRARDRLSAILRGWPPG